MPAAAGPSRPSFRPRPIDLAKPLPIIKSSKDLRHEDDVVVNRALPTIATGVDPSEEEERHLQQALLASVFGSSDKPPDIPVPVVSQVKPPDTRRDFRLPETYIQFDRNDAELLKNSVEYDADWEDYAFAKKAAIDIDLVEVAMDALEKLQGQLQQSQHLHQHQANDGTDALDGADVKHIFDADADDEAAASALGNSKAVPAKNSSNTTDNKVGMTTNALKGNDDSAAQNATTEKLMKDRSACPDFDKLTSGISDKQRDQLFQHWHQRRTKHKKAFIRYFQPAPDPNDTDPSVAFRPRDREGGVPIAHRMNTYDNYRRALIIRDELAKLSKIMSMVVERERKKGELLNLQFLLQRVKITSAAPAQVDNIVRHVFLNDAEPVLQLASHQTPKQTSQSQSLQQAPTIGVGMGIVPCRGIQVPQEVQVSMRRFVHDKNTTKKQRRRPKEKRIGSGASAVKDPSMSQDGANNVGGGMVGATFDRSINVAPNNANHHHPLQQHSPTGIAQIDTFGFDEHGNRFLKLMRCFAGGFNNYGVSPYDHRVFAAASERNTVRTLPRDPKPVLFPSSAIKFASRLEEPEENDDDKDDFFEDDEDDDDDDDENINRSSSTMWSSHGRGRGKGIGKGRGKGGGKTGPRSRKDENQPKQQPFVTPEQVQHDIMNGIRGMSSEGSKDPAIARPSKVRRTAVRVRGRVGRGGRIVFDRVPFEAERGAKAASYPASVEMGGVYTGGVPLDCAGQVSQEVNRGLMGEVQRLCPKSVGASNEHSDEDDEQRTFAKHLYTPLRPMVEANKGTVSSSNPEVISYWPSKQYKSSSRQQKRTSGGLVKSATNNGVGKTVPQSPRQQHQFDNHTLTNFAYPHHQLHSTENNRDSESDAETETLSVLRQHDDLRRLPAYHPRDDSPIHDLFHR